MDGYHAFARYYDALTRNVDYRRRAEFFDELIRRYQKETGLLLDLACGTGSLALALADRGYDVICADASEEMLSVALKKTYASPHRILYLHQAMDELDLYGTVDVVICALDSINHIADEELLLKSFQKISLFMNPNGLFIFDVNTPYKHRQVLADNTFIYDTPEVFCVWQNAYHPQRDRVDITLDFFAHDESGRYVRETEAFSEWIYPDQTLKELLVKTGFKPMQILEGDKFAQISANAERLVYVAKKL